MELCRAKEGYYYFDVNTTKVILLLTEDLLPEDGSLQKLEWIAQEFEVDGRIVCLPDLHFKVKNFIPSGIITPVREYFSPLLLGPNNDGMGTIKVRLKSNRFKDSEIIAIFSRLKERIVMFRRDTDAINSDTLEKICMTGIQNIIEEWGFTKSDLSKFEDNGCTKAFNDMYDIVNSFPGERPESLPDFVPNCDIFDRGKKCIGVLDGTSHFIELFRVAASIEPEYEKLLDIRENDCFFLVHAGGGDIGILSHRAYLNDHDNKYYLNREEGTTALNSFAVAGNCSFANRLYIYKVIKEVLEEVLPNIECIEIFSDIPHDYLERSDDVFLHRKGAVKLLPACCFDSDNPWGRVGMPYIFPSCVGADAYIISNPEGAKLTYNTTSHGAGRLIRKDAAIEQYKNTDLESSMKNRIKLFRYGVDQIEGQNPSAFKDGDLMMEFFEQYGLAHGITKLKPLASLKA